MYAGTTFHGKSGGVIGVHQKIDRIARRNLNALPKVSKRFPGIRAILHFEGNNGPDGIHRKSPGQDDPWHFINPEDPTDTALVQMMLDHKDNLVTALRENNPERAAFEAAWLAHVIADGLTPAHHYPLADKIEELWGKPHDERITLREKNIIPGDSRRESISKNWEYWGAKGIWTTHFLFEWGVAASIKTTTFPNSTPSAKWLAAADKKGLERVFLDAVDEVYELGMYERFWKQGWNTKLARQTRAVLIPKICAVITYAWYTADREAASGAN